MKRIITCIYFLYFSLVSWAQGLYDLDYLESQDKASLSFGLYTNVSSTGLNTKFVSKFINGGYIEGQLIDDILQNLSGTQTIGTDLRPTLFYQHSGKRIFGSDNMHWMLQLGSRGFAEASFPSDFFELIFSGNKNFENRTAQIHPFGFQSIVYHKLQIGLCKQSAGHRFGVLLGPVLGSSYYKSSTDRGSIFTAQDGRYLDLDLKWQLEQSNPDKNHLMSNSGVGIAADLFWKWNFREHSAFILMAEDLGVISWDGDAQLSQIDSSFRFEGVEIGSIFDSIFVEIKSGSDLKSEFLKEQRKKIPAAVLPASLSLEFRRQFLNNKFVANLYIQKYISRFSKFQVAAGLNYNIWNGFQVGATGGLSSHGNWYAGIQMHVFRKDNFQLKIAAPSLINIFQGERNFVAIGQVLLSKAF